MKRSLPFLVVIFLGVVLYGHTLQVPFYLDDAGAIYDKKAVKDLSRAFAELFDKRGLSNLTFALNYQLGELNVIGYHLVNIAIHLGSSCLVLLLLRRILPQRAVLQLFGALIFVAHPLQTQAVTYLAQRMTSLSALLFLLALYLFALARERLAICGDFREPRHLYCYIGSLLAGGAAILAKENAVVLPLALLLYARLFLPDGGGGWRLLLRYLAPFLVLPALAVAGYLLVPLLSGSSLNTMGHSRHLRSMEGNSPLHYLATQCSVLWVYLRMLFVPYGQALDHGYPVSRDLLTFQSGFGGLGLVGLLSLAWHWRHRRPLMAGGIFWFFLTLAVESSVIPLDPLFEHRLYLPMFGFAMLVSDLVGRLPRQAWQIGLSVVVVMTLSVLTWQRNALWNDPIAFHEDNLRVAPDNERVYFNLGQEYLQAGILERGEALVRESIALNPVRHLGYLSLKELYVAQGRLDEAIGMLKYGIDHVDQSHLGPLYNELAFVYGKQGDFAAAAVALQQAIAADPDVATTYFNLAQMLMFTGERELVAANLRKVLELDPSHAEAKAMLDNLLEKRTGSPPLEK